jgi:transcription initiation factor IIF auxiliary subunit
MDGWGSLTMLIKRQNASKYRKAELRYELQKRKESYVKDAYDMDQTLEFPELSAHEMNVLKQEIRTKLKKERRRNLLSYLLVITLILLFAFIMYALKWLPELLLR